MKQGGREGGREEGRSNPCRLDKKIISLMRRIKVRVAPRVRFQTLGYLATRKAERGMGERGRGKVVSKKGVSLSFTINKGGTEEGFVCMRIGSTDLMGGGRVVSFPTSPPCPCEFIHSR